MKAIAAGCAAIVVVPLVLVAAVIGALTGAGGASYDVAPTRSVAAAISYARAQLGVRYQWGGETPADGFDCSGLVQTAYATAGVKLPRTAQTQYDAGPLLPPGVPPQPGDLVFFGTPDRVYHVGLVISSTHMIEAPYTGQVVRERPFRRRSLLGFSRPTARALSDAAPAAGPVPGHRTPTALSGPELRPPATAGLAHSMRHSPPPSCRRRRRS